MNRSTRRPIVGVMGSGSDRHPAVAEEIGRLLARLGVHLLTGGGGGVMAAVSQAFAESQQRQGLVIGVLPCSEDDPCSRDDRYPNPWVEIPVFTHLPFSGRRGTDKMSRNHINVLTSDVIVVLPGSHGTASEASLAIRYQRPVVAYLSDEHDVPGLPNDVPVVRSIEQVEEFVRSHLPAATQ